MAADSTGKASSGSPFRAPPATIWNNMVDAGRAFADGQLSSGTPAATRARATDLLHMKNSSGAMRRKGEILKIDGKVITTLTAENIWLDGVEPTDDCRFGILKNPASDAEIVASQVSGVCMALVDVADADHTFAYAADGEYVLQSGDSGPLEILHSDGTGEQECVVRFVGPGRMLVGKADADITKGDLGTISIWAETGSPLTEYDTGNDKSARARLGDVTSGSWVYIHHFTGGWEIVNAECP